MSENMEKIEVYRVDGEDVSKHVFEVIERAIEGQNDKIKDLLEQLDEIKSKQPRLETMVDAADDLEAYSIKLEGEVKDLKEQLERIQDTDSLVKERDRLKEQLENFDKPGAYHYWRSACRDVEQENRKLNRALESAKELGFCVKEKCEKIEPLKVQLDECKKIRKDLERECNKRESILIGKRNKIAELEKQASHHFCKDLIKSIEKERDGYKENAAKWDAMKPGELYPPLQKRVDALDAIIAKLGEGYEFFQATRADGSTYIAMHRPTDDVQEIFEFEATSYAVDKEGKDDAE